MNQGELGNINQKPVSRTVEGVLGSHFWFLDSGGERNEAYDPAHFVEFDPIQGNRGAADGNGSPYCTLALQQFLQYSRCAQPSGVFL